MDVSGKINIFGVKDKKTDFKYLQRYQFTRLRSDESLVFFFAIQQASEETGHRRSTRATVDITVSGTNNFDPVVTSSSGNFIGTISEDADAGTPLRSQGSTNTLQLIVTDQDVVCLSPFH